MSRKRQYAPQQFDYANAAPQAAAPPAATENGSVFTPGAPDLAYQMQGLNVGGQPAPASPAVPGYTPGYGAGYQSQYGSGQQKVPKVPLNELYTIDLLASMPPSVSDLSLPPPPLTVSPEASCYQSEYANAGPEFIRSTLNVAPNAASVLRKSKLPFAVVVRPSNALRYEDEGVPVVGDSVIARCRRCRTYINPFVEIRDTKWTCNICNLNNEVPTAFDWDANANLRADRSVRPELNYGVVDFIAPPEYLVRPPQPPAYVFVLDVSVNAISNGLLATAARIIHENLDRLPNKDERTRVAFIGVDGVLNFFQIPEDSDEDTEPSLLVVSDLDDPFLPTPEGLLCRLSERRKGIDAVLSSIGKMYSTNVASSNALGSALQAAYKLVSNIGGKIVCISASYPNVGKAKLDQREDTKLYGTTKEKDLFNTADNFYKQFAVDCNKSQVSVDMFLLSSQYQDVASLSALPRFTAGNTFHYPGWNANRDTDVEKLAHELGEYMSQEVATEAVLRVRASTGVRSSNYFGNFFVRSSDLMSFSFFPRDQAYVVELTIDEPTTKPYLYVQAALLHTTCHGERRVRVINLALPTSAKVSDVYASADQLAITQFLTHKAVETAVSSGIKATQEFLSNQALAILKAFKTDALNTNSGSGGPLQLSANLRMLPLLITALKKTVALRNSNRISSDLRLAGMNLLTTLPTPHLIKYLYPDFYALHDLPEGAGLEDPETGAIALPPRLNLTAERLEPHGLYLIDDGQVLFLWICRDAVPQLLTDAFGVDNQEALPAGKTTLPEVDTELNRRIRNIVNVSRSHRDVVYWPYLYVLKENSEPSLRLWASTFLVEDRAEGETSYFQYLNDLRAKLSA